MLTGLGSPRGGTQIVNSGDRPFKEAEGRRIPVCLRGSPNLDIIARMPGPTRAGRN
jgi:hypothetical protein